MTERERVAAQRAGFRLGFTAAGGDAGAAERLAKYYYEYPKVTRPRIVQDPMPSYTQKWKCEAGEIYWQPYTDGRWVRFAETPDLGRRDTITFPTRERILLWADLFANPTEEVEDDA